jgi:fatty-acyl-CoA synthase
MGSKLVIPGQKVDGESLHRLFEEHGVTFGNGVPTVWLGYVQYLQGVGVKPTTLNRVDRRNSVPAFPDGSAAG